MACQQDRLSVPAQKIPLILKSDLIEEVKVSKKTKIKKGEGLFSAMERIDLYGKEALSIVNNLRDEIELSAVMPGNTIEVTKEGNQLKTFSFENSLLKKHFLDRQGDKWIYRVAKKVTTIDHVKIEGYLRKNSTLEQDLISNGLSKESSNEVISALMCKINFRLHARQGDFLRFY